MRSLLKIVFAAAIVFGLSASARATVYTGISTNRSSLPNPVNATATPSSGTWNTQGVSLAWTVTENANGSWNYSYTFDRPSQGALSHIIIELSPGVVAGDLLNLALTGSTLRQIEVKEHTPQQGNPDMPGNLYGVKLDVNNPDANLTTTISFDIFRAPVWGDWYAVDGVHGRAWNTGFAAADPDLPPANTADLASTDARYGHILRPDTIPIPPIAIPEPSTLVLAVGCVGPLAAIRAVRRRRRGGEDTA